MYCKLYARIPSPPSAEKLAAEFADKVCEGRSPCHASELGTHAQSPASGVLNGYADRLYWPGIYARGQGSESERVLAPLRAAEAVCSASHAATARASERASALVPDPGGAGARARGGALPLVSGTAPRELRTGRAQSTAWRRVAAGAAHPHVAQRHVHQRPRPGDRQVRGGVVFCESRQWFHSARHEQAELQHTADDSSVARFSFHAVRHGAFGRNSHMTSAARTWRQILVLMSVTTSCTHSRHMKRIGCISLAHFERSSRTFRNS